MSSDETLFRIVLEGIHATGRHGANPGEQDLPQEFVVDVEALVEVGFDELAETADYSHIVLVARDAVEGDPRVLLESLAAAIAESIFEMDENVMQAIATVHKPGAASALGLDDVAVVATFPPGTLDGP